LTLQQNKLERLSLAIFSVKSKVSKVTNLPSKLIYLTSDYRVTQKTLKR
jgi:hypothetical protein